MFWFHISLSFSLKARLPSVAHDGHSAIFCAHHFPSPGGRVMSCDCAPPWNKFLVTAWNGFALHCPAEWVCSLQKTSSLQLPQPWYPRFYDEDVWKPQVPSCHSEFIDMTTFFWVPANEWITPGLEHRAQRDGYGWNLELVYVSISCPSLPLKIYTYICFF